MVGDYSTAVCDLDKSIDTHPNVLTGAARDEDGTTIGERQIARDGARSLAGSVLL